jgi:hypothetical protein
MSYELKQQACHRPSRAATGVNSRAETRLELDTLQLSCQGAQNRASIGFDSLTKPSESQKTNQGG